MKKQLVIALLSVTLTACIFAGCGSTGGAGTESTAVVTESILETEGIENTEVEEEVAETAEVETEVEETEVTETEPTEVETGVIEPEGTELESTETEAGESLMVEPTEAEVVESETEVETEAEPEVSYSYTDMDAVMWATAAVNVRDLPSTDGARVGGLSRGQEVRVTGVCNETGWYRLEGDSRFVSGSYLSSSAPVAEAASSPSTSAADSTTSQATQATQGTVGAAPVAAQTSGAYSEAQLVGEFLTILNNQRAAEGLSQVSGGSDALNSDALASVTAVQANFSHDSIVRNSGVNRANIAQGQQSAQEVFDAWYASDGRPWLCRRPRRWQHRMSS